MKFILLLLIRFYWFIVPENKRKKCLFRESCSKYVYRITDEKGLVKGISALWDRIKKCRPGYQFYRLDNSYILILKDGTTLQENDISINLINQAK